MGKLSYVLYSPNGAHLSSVVFAHVYRVQMISSRRLVQLKWYICKRQLNNPAFILIISSDHLLRACLDSFSF
uniref:Uncharacterized protein n=1 Tax=Arundo donax TaxID=35708 RepID=A0A0A9BAS8_ARUDO